MASLRSKYPVGNVNACKGSFRCTVNITVFVSGFFDLFDVKCKLKQQHRTVLYPFLNSTKMVTLTVRVNGP